LDINELPPLPNKKALAVLLAAGSGVGFNGEGLLPKPLIPFEGEPVGRRVLRALHGYPFACIFVTHDAQVNLVRPLQGGGRDVFIPLANPDSFDEVVSAVLGQVTRFFSPAELAQYELLFVPCDLPLLSTAQLGAFLSEAARTEADVVVPFIAGKLLRARFPGKRFTSFYLRDRRGAYAPQALWLVRGALLGRLNESGHLARRWGKWEAQSDDALWLIEAFSALRRGRGRPWHRFAILAKALGRLLAKGERRLYFLLFQAIVRRGMTVELWRLMVRTLTGLSCEFVETTAPEFSGDIDRPGEEALFNPERLGEVEEKRAGVKAAGATLGPKPD
jgi:CTP:molybdopterin cytidylyltransferase MocA